MVTSCAPAKFTGVDLLANMCEDRFIPPGGRGMELSAEDPQERSGLV